MALDMNALNGRTPPRMPFWWFIVQCVTLVLALAVFIASCYAIHHAPGGGPQAFLLFDCLMIFIFVGGFIAIEKFQPSLYFRLIFIVAYTLIIIFLLSAWAWAASVAGVFLERVCYFGTCYGGATGVGAALAVGAALGAVMWVLMIVSLVFYVMACFKQGGDGVAAPTAAAHNDAEMGAVKTEQPAVAADQQQQAYPQQPYQQPMESYPQQPEQQQAAYPQDTPYAEAPAQYPPQEQAQYPPQPQQQQQTPYPQQ